MKLEKIAPVAGRAKQGSPNRKTHQRLLVRRKDYLTISDKHPTGSFHLPGSMQKK